MTTLSWDLVGGDPARGTPDAYATLARDLADTAERALDAGDKLRRFASSCDDAIWRGAAAEAFREKIAELPPKLGQLERSYDTASRAMDNYRLTLADLQPRARAALEQAHSASQDEASQRQARDQAHADARVEDPLAPVDTPTIDGNIDEAAGRLDRARREIDHIRDEREGAEQRAVGGLEHASDLGIQNDNWFTRAFDAVGDWIDEHADVLKTISEALKWVSGVAGLLSLIPGLGIIFGPIALLAGGLAFAIDAALVLTGNGTWKTLLVDAALMALPGVGRLAKSGVAFATKRVAKAARPPQGFSAAGRMGRSKAFATRVTSGDPIDVASGEMVMNETDVALAGMLPLVLTRTHVSSYREGRWFGPSWASTLDQRLEVDREGVCFVAPDGMVLDYPTPGPNPVLPLEGPRWPLARRDEGDYTVTDVDRGQTLHFAAVGSLRVGARAELLALAAVTDRTGHRIDLDYDAGGDLRQIKTSGGYRIAVETSAGRIAALCLRAAAGDTDIELVRYGYDEGANLSEVVNSSGLPLRFDYDPAGRITRWEDRNGVSYHYTYDADGRCAAASGPDGFMDNALAYDDDARVTVATNSLGHATTYHLNERKQVIREVDPLGNATVSEWDGQDRLLARTDALGRTTRYAYDEAGNLVTVARPDGCQILSEYNDRRLPIVVTGPDGMSWRREYDDRGNLTVVTDPLGATTRYSYDDLCHLTSVTGALGQAHTVATDAAGLAISVTDPLGSTTRYDRDAFGRVVAIIDPVGGVMRTEWTVEGRLATRVLPDGATERWTYDSEGNLLEYADANGHATRTEITHFDLPAAEVGPDGARLEFSYDTELRLVAVTNPEGLVWRYDYDPAGNLVRESDFNGRELHYRHDAGGQLVERTNGAGELTRFSRDALGNVTEQRGGDTVTIFDYDPAGRLVRAANADADLRVARDARGRVLAETCNDRTVTSGYDAVGRRTSRRTPSGAESFWEYDASDQPIALHASGHTIRFSYDAAGREVERLLGGATLAQTWDANHRLASQTVTADERDVPRPGSARQDRLVQHRTFGYRPDGYVDRIEDHLSGCRTFDLDAVGRVTAVRGAGWTERYAYDPAGNVSSAAWPTSQASPDIDAQGERTYAGTLIRRAGRVRYEHDAQGRVVLRQQKRTSGKPRTWHYSWDGDDRLVGVTTPEGQRWQYRYDALGRRVAKQRLAPDGETVAEQVDFTWDGAMLAEQTTTGGEPGPARTTVWEWEANRFRPVSQSQRAPLDGAPQEWIDEQFHAIVTDLVGTPIEMVDADGNLAWHSRTTLWGTEVTAEPDEVSCPLRFPGQSRDEETGLNYNFFRYYEPVAGRYQSSDPIGLAGGPNPHSYVPNPTGWSDPLGLKGNCGPNDDIAVIGRQWDTAVAKDWPGHEVLDLPHWTIAKNDAWVRSVVDRRMRVYVGSPETKANLWDTVNDRATVFDRELQQLLDAGYRRSGDYLNPPGG